MKLNAKFETNQCTSIDQVSAFVDLDLTQCTGGGIKYIEVVLYQNIRLRLRSQYGHQLRYQLIKDQLPGLKAGEKTGDEHKITLDLNLATDP